MITGTNVHRRSVRRAAGLLLGIALLGGAMAAPAAAAVTSQEEIPIAYLLIDEANGLLGFVNVNRANRCAWAPPAPYPANSTVTVRFIEPRPGVTMLSYTATLSIELWRLDTGTYDFSQGPCENTAAQTSPFATGTARISAGDNDLDVSLTRGNAFGETGTATVYEPTGQAWSYSWTFRGLGIPPEDCACRVIVDRYSLRRHG
jgi:hypothetical protein